MRRPFLHLAAAALLVTSACRTTATAPGAPGRLEATPARALAQGEGFTIGENEFRAHWEATCRPATSPPKPVCLPDGRGQLLEELIKFQVLLDEAFRRGLDGDPEIRAALARIMVQKLFQQWSATSAAQPAPEGSTAEERMAARTCKTAEFDAWIGELRERAHVRIDAAALNAVQLSP